MEKYYLINYLMYFFIYAFIGWVVEVSYHAVTKKMFINRGFLRGPYCPIYGFGAVAVIIILKNIAENNKTVLFFGSMFIASLIEFIVGFILEKIFHKRWWDYSNRKLNIGGYICLEFSVIWGIFCYILFEKIHPVTGNLVKLIPRNVILYLDIAFALVMILDLITTINTLIGLNKKLKMIDDISADIKSVSDKIGMKVYDKTISIENRQQQIKEIAAVKEFEEDIKEFKYRIEDKSDERRILKAFPNLSKNLEEAQVDLEEIKKLIRDNEHL